MSGVVRRQRTNSQKERQENKAKPGTLQNHETGMLGLEESTQFNRVHCCIVTSYTYIWEMPGSNLGPDIG
jgi:hypothetical protein